ncbi:class I SAM-dependent methyltransferase [Streptomyces sp. VRA16 Mangrove soil]|uniref:class I SAM-dependent methyltransferase n=1 Tax=Streptomyces sp. VRA16 Mangrove soil TaxID=2817434 RepID=UPI001A9E9026|nr:class I SAM-dependent methyltransferase [Streptomyces sp. VRA16 Mangrove soil]MBO1332207.1 class I SAM-dependent methyltransferase [Streptomyces sp. VRA16 Mangrove soil]
MTDASRARAFDRAAARYAAHRPSYPPAVLDAAEEFLGRSLAGARVADVGAGTGIAAALLRERGAQVVAVEPGEGMAAQFRRDHPGLPVVRGDGNALPLRGDRMDLVTYAQAWQWTDTARSVPEALRVLRPGGALAIWWNTTALDVPWIAAQHARIAAYCGVEARTAPPLDDAEAVAAAGLTGLRTRRHRLPWTRTVPLDTHLANLGSRSALLVLGEERVNAFLAEERERLRRRAPGGEETVEECYVVDLFLASGS